MNSGRRSVPPAEPKMTSLKWYSWRRLSHELNKRCRMMGRCSAVRRPRRRQAMTCAMLFKRSIVFAMSTSVIIIVAIAMSATAQDGRAASHYTVSTLPLPDNGTGDVSMDYIAFDPAANSLWVPAGNTAAVDVVDVATGKVRQI